MSIFVRQKSGLSFENDKIKVFFGNKMFTTGQLTVEKNFGLHSVKQTHSDGFFTVDDVKPASPTPDGDALGTVLLNQYLFVKTADCLPILIHDPLTNQIAAVHSGWKGVSISIVPKIVGKYFGKSKSLVLYVGPYIMKPSFEVRIDVLDQILNSVDSSIRGQIQVDSHTDKFNLDLLDVIRAQLSFIYPKIIFDIQDSGVDTKASTEFHSHRREPATKGRNLSYIFLK